MQQAKWGVRSSPILSSAAAICSLYQHLQQKFIVEQDPEASTPTVSDVEIASAAKGSAMDQFLREKSKYFATSFSHVDIGIILRDTIII